MQGTTGTTLAMGICLAAFAFGPADARPAPHEGVVAVTRGFLDSYAKGDNDAVLRQVDPKVVVYGSDIAEVFRGSAGVREMLTADHRLWGGAVSIGDMRDISVVSSGPLSAITFDAPFELRGGSPIMVRFSMVWKHEAAGWRLLQCANSTPTVGQSAEALLKARP